MTQLFNGKVLEEFNQGEDEEICQDSIKFMPMFDG